MFSKVAGCRRATLPKLKSFTNIFHRFSPHTQLDTLQNTYFVKHLFLQNNFSG